MSKIVIIPEKSQCESSVLVLLKKITEEAIGAVKAHFQNATPLYQCNLFYNDHKEVTDKLLSILTVLDNHAVKYRIYESDETMPYSSETINSTEEISRETLENILNAF